MSNRTYSDICESVVNLGDVSLPFLNDDEFDLQKGWSLVYSAFEAGKNKRLICSFCFAKIKDSKLYVVCILNSSQYASGGGTDWTLFTENNEIEVFHDLENNNLDEDCPLKFEQNLKVASPKESIELFLFDFGFENLEIKETDAVSQTL